MSMISLQHLIMLFLLALAMYQLFCQAGMLSRSSHNMDVLLEVAQSRSSALVKLDGTPIMGGVGESH